MTGPRLLVFGDDGSDTADAVWGWIDGHLWPDWRLEVVTAQPPPDMRPVPVEEATPHAWEPPTPRAPHREGSFVEVAHLTAAADPRVVLDRSCDMLVIGPRGPGLLKSLHIGSTAEWLMQSPPAPMAVVSRAGPVEAALVCDDGSAHARASAEAFASLPWAAAVDVTVITVDDGRVGGPTRNEGLFPDARRVTRPGNPSQEILAEIEQRSPGLVVLGVRGHSLLQRLTVGSTTSAVLRSGRANVLVAPAQ